MKIFSWNINGIRAVLRKDALVPFLETYDPDILCLQETKANRDQVEIDFKDYEEFWNSAERKGHFGTAIFIKNSLKKALIKDISGIPTNIAKKYTLTDSYGDTTTEGRVLTLEFKDFFVSTVYTPNAKDDLTRIPMRKEWDPAFLAYMRSLGKKKPLIYCGDFNVAHTPDDLARPKENEGNKGFTKEERAGFNAMVEAGFIDTFRQFYKGNGYYTWWSHFRNARARNVGWRIDYIMLSKSLLPKLKSAAIHPEVMGSDHCPISIDIQ